MPRSKSAPLLLLMLAACSGRDREPLERGQNALGRIMVVDSVLDERDDDPTDGICRSRSGVCTLRAAIDETNAIEGADSIHFAIPGAGPHRIQLRSILTYVTDTVTIDGYTQPGSRPNSQPLSDDAALMIEVDMSDVPYSGTDADTTLLIDASDSFVTGLALFGSVYAELEIVGRRNVIEGNFIGLDAAGIAHRGRGIMTIRHSDDNVVGGPEPAQRNVIGELHLFAPTSERNRVQGNFMATDPSGTRLARDLEPSPGEFRPAVLHLELADNNLIGGTGPGEGNVIGGGPDHGVALDVARDNVVTGNTIGMGVDGTPFGFGLEGLYMNQDSSRNLISGNVIAHAATAGVLVQRSIDNTIVDNLIFDNGGLAIDLSFASCDWRREACPDGVTANDAADADDGPNHVQNFPELLSSRREGGDWVVEGRLDTEPSAGVYRIQLFSAATCHPLGHGEAEALVVDTTVTTDAAGHATFALAVPGTLAEATALSATATSPSGNTSEMSACLTLNQGPAISCRDVLLGADSTCSANGSVVVSVADPDGDPVTVIETPEGPYALGTTFVRATATDSEGASAECSAYVTVVDVTAPVAVCPADVSLPAEDSSGANVSYVATGTDNCDEVAPLCTPASGSRYAIGNTVTTCRVLDEAGLDSTCSFSVTVLGAGDQLRALRDEVIALGLGPGTENSLVVKLENALEAIAASDTAAACRRLGTFVSQVRALRGVQIPTAAADRLLAEAERIQRVLGC